MAGRLHNVTVGRVTNRIIRSEAVLFAEIILPGERSFAPVLGAVEAVPQPRLFSFGSSESMQRFMRQLRTVLVAVLILARAVPAWATTVEPRAGEVFIDRGSGYVRVEGPITANPGNTVMAMAGGSAVIVYDNGCRQSVELGVLVTITETPPCAPAFETTTTVETATTDYSLILLGGVAVAGGVVAAIALGGGDGGGDSPASK